MLIFITPKILREGVTAELRAEERPADERRRLQRELPSRPGAVMQRCAYCWSRTMSWSPTRSCAAYRSPASRSITPAAPSWRERRSPIEHFDLAIVDIGLPGADGLSLLKSMRAEGRATPVLILTARFTLPDKVRAFELGADDFLMKPFEQAELVARCRALIRRAGQVPERRAAPGRLSIDLNGHQLLLDGRCRRAHAARVGGARESRAQSRARRRQGAAAAGAVRLGAGAERQCAGDAGLAAARQARRGCA